MPFSRSPVTREELMVALQNVQLVLVQATFSSNVDHATLDDVTLDVAKTKEELVRASGRDYYTPGMSRATGIEMCDCPKEYSGYSCQVWQLIRGFSRFNFLLP